MAEVNDWDKPKAQLIEELAALRAEVAHLRVKPEISPRGQSLSLAEGDRLLLAKGNGVSALRKDSSSASSNLAEASAPGMSPRCLLFDPLMPFQPEQVGYPFTLEQDCLQPEQLLSSFFNAAAHSKGISRKELTPSFPRRRESSTRVSRYWVSSFPENA